jgi:hypothetical protein
MAEMGRTTSSDDCIQALDGGKGTLIREWKGRFVGPTRYWWTEDDLFAKSPFPIADRATRTPVAKTSRFTQWCFDEYINVSNGKAMLVVIPKQQRKILREKLKQVTKIEVRTLMREGW